MNSAIAKTATIAKGKHGDIQVAGHNGTWLQASINILTGEILTYSAAKEGNTIIYHDTNIETFYHGNKHVTIRDIKQIAQAYLDMRRAGFGIFLSLEGANTTARYIL